MTWQSAMTRLNDAVLGHLGGRDYRIKVASGENILQGVYRAPWTGSSIGGVPIDRPEPTIHFRSAEFLALNPQSGMTVTEVEVEGMSADMEKPMTILDWQPDDGGMVEVTLGGYR